MSVQKKRRASLNEKLMNIYKHFEQRKELMKNKLFRTYLALVIVGFCLLLFPGCSTHTGASSKWDYYTPEHVRCYDNQTKMCRHYGARLICECVA